MKKSLILFAISFLLIASAGCAAPPVPTQEVEETPTETAVPQPTAAETDLEGWELVWSDEFDGESLDRGAWTFDTGAGGWGNEELQFYTDRPENVRLEDGSLVIEARKEDYRGSGYTSGRIKTQELLDWTYGRFEARMKLPTGQGVWSAFWLLGADINTVSWPGSGEIDIMENIGDPNAIGGALHGPGYSGGDNVGTTYVSTALNVEEDFHVYAIEWYPDEITWFVDDVAYNRVAFDGVPGVWVYDHPFFIILNLAIGGTYPGYPDGTTIFPREVLVDYVRVYRDPDLVIQEKQQMHVDQIQSDFSQEGERWEASMTVAVVDQDGNPVEGAIVKAGWLGVVAGADTEMTTDAAGVAGPFVALQAPSADEISFCIVDLAQVNYSYDKSANTQTCQFVEPGAP